MDNSSLPEPKPTRHSDADAPAPEANRLRFFTTPLSRRGLPVWLVYLLTVLGVIYLLNPTLGVFELVPDNLPFIGNLDEGAAVLLIWFGLVEFLSGKKGVPPSE